MKVSVIGMGSWACALAQVLDDNGHSVLMWSKFSEEVEEMNSKHTAKVYLDDHVFASSIKATNSLSEVMDFANYVIFALPTKFSRTVISEIAELNYENKIFINVSKGIEPKTNLLISDVFQEVLTKNFKYAVLSGPTHAEEVVLRIISSIVSASEDEEVAKAVQGLFNNSYFRVYTSNDIIGVQIAGALKNIIAIASGICAGLGYGDNTRASLITRGLAEIVKYAVSHGANKETMYGLAGVGDLIVTTSSHHSRNFKTGLAVGKGEDPQKAIENSIMIVEGIRSCLAVHEELPDLDFEMPISLGVYKVFYEGVSPEEVIEELMSRAVRAERVEV